MVRPLGMRTEQSRHIIEQILILGLYTMKTKISHAYFKMAFQFLPFRLRSENRQPSSSQNQITKHDKDSL